MAKWIVVLMAIISSAPGVCGQEPEPDGFEPPPVQIVMHVPDFKCDACLRWKLNVLPELIKDYNLTETRAKFTGSFPCFSVLSAGRWIRVTGYPSARQMREWIEK